MGILRCHSAIIHRSALVFYGHNPAPDVAYMLANGTGGDRQEVTWSDVMAERRRDQARRLENKRRSVIWRPYKVWVAFYSQFLMGGWHAFIENRDGRHWIDRDRGGLRQELMELFPLVLAMRATEDYTQAGVADDFHRWKVEFAKQFQRRTQCRRPLGVAYVWSDGGYQLRKDAP